MIPTLAERSRRRRLRERAWGEERLTSSAVDGAPPVGLAPFLPQSRPEPPPSQGSMETAALAGPVERSGARVHRSAGAAVTAKPALELLLWLALLLFDAGGARFPADAGRGSFAATGPGW